MNPCDPTLNRPVPSTGENPPFMPVKCDRCGHTHNLHGDCVSKGYPPAVAVGAMVEMGIDESKARKVLFFAIPDAKEMKSASDIGELMQRERPRIEQLPGQPKFNSLHISHLPQKIDGVTEHVFVAILNGEAVGSAITTIHPDKACGIRAVYVRHINRRMGIATRLVKAIEAWARIERAITLEIGVQRGNAQARQFWIRQRFIDDDSAPNVLGPQYVSMTKTL